ncbi:hypothetical protein C8R44DRAFT_805351, partial [Mycena epipterygia]
SAPSRASASPALRFRDTLHRCLDPRVPRQYAQTQESRHRHHHPCTRYRTEKSPDADSCIRDAAIYGVCWGAPWHRPPRIPRTSRRQRTRSADGPRGGIWRRRKGGDRFAWWAAGTELEGRCGGECGGERSAAQLDTNPGGWRGGTERRRRRGAYGEGGGLRWTLDSRGVGAAVAISPEMAQGYERGWADGLESQREEAASGAHLGSAS